MSDVNQTTEPQSEFAAYIAAEREQLTNQRRVLNEYIVDCQKNLIALELEFAAIDAYEAAKAGKAARAGGASTGRLTRTRNGSRREELLKLIGGGNGLFRGDMLERMGLKGDRAGEMSVTNALAALKKRGEVRHEDGKYYPAEPAHAPGQGHADWAQGQSQAAE